MRKISPDIGFAGPGSYQSVRKEAERSGLSMATMAETLDILYAAQENPEREYSGEILNAFRGCPGLFCSNGILHIPDEGDYIQDRPELTDGRILMEREGLLGRMAAGDNGVRFVRGDYRTGELGESEITDHEYIIGLGDQGFAEKLAAFSKRYGAGLSLGGLGDEPCVRVAFLADARDFAWDLGRLLISGFSQGFNYGRAFALSGKRENNWKRVSNHDSENS